jgi:hypothetical protein
MRYERIKITRDPHTVYNRSVFPWEIAILEFTFGDGNVNRLEEFETTDTPYPEPTVEFQRLGSAYGADPQSGVPYVASVYGQASAGVNHLRRAIAEAKAAEEALKPKPSRKVKTTRKRVVETDPLLA